MTVVLLLCAVIVLSDHQCNPLLYYKHFLDQLWSSWLPHTSVLLPSSSRVIVTRLSVSTLPSSLSASQPMVPSLFLLPAYIHTVLHFPSILLLVFHLTSHPFFLLADVASFIPPKTSLLSVFRSLVLSAYTSTSHLLISYFLIFSFICIYSLVRHF